MNIPPVIHDIALKASQAIASLANLNWEQSGVSAVIVAVVVLFVLFAAWQVTAHVAESSADRVEARADNWKHR
jgi:hypothetical protein